jgi:hypothetical protein
MSRSFFLQEKRQMRGHWLAASMGKENAETVFPDKFIDCLAIRYLKSFWRVHGIPHLLSLFNQFVVPLRIQAVGIDFAGRDGFLSGLRVA